MKIQSLAVIMAIILLPIIIILSYYIHGEVDTIVLQTSYDTKLIDSTHDAMSSFEMNTANENLSSVADSLRSIIEASTNVFFNTLATNLGISNAGNAAVDSYIPALLYTLYDGYYIYSPTRIPTVLTYQEDDIVYVGDRGVTLKNKITYTNESNQTVEIGVYEFNEVEYAKEKDDNPSNDENSITRNARQNALYTNLTTKGISYEYGQMLYENEPDAHGNITYSTQLHTDEANLVPDTKYKEEHVLKSYMPYSARYQKGTDFDVTINYTLDNYMTVEGNIKDVYYSKTGYLIAKDTVTSVALKEPGTNNIVVGDILSYNEIAAEEMILSGQYDIELKIKPILENNTRASEMTITYARQDYGTDGSYTKLKERLAKLYEDQDGVQLDGTRNIDIIQELEYELANLSSIAYYVKAQIFSNWVYENLADLKACDISEDIANLNENVYTTDGTSEIFHKFIITDDAGNITYKDETLVFDSTANPELEDSPFFTHKLDVIRNNIQYNLNLAISAYNQMLQTRNVQMPVIKESEWEHILTRVSIVSFMQGLNCGMKTYNNYAIASSTNNELTVMPNEIYYTYKEQYNSAEITDEYHKIDCDDLLSNDGSDKQYISFKSKEIKYDKIYNKESKKYLYDHRNMGCYRCAITSNYEKDVYDESGNIVRGYSDDIKISLLSPVKQKAYFVAVAKERQNLYKTNALTDSNGYEIYYNGEGAVNFPAESTPTAVRINTGNSKRSLSDIREIEITLRDLQCTNESEATVNFRLVLNDNIEIDYNTVMNLAQSTPQTIVIPVHVTSASKCRSVSLKKVDLDDAVTCKKLNVRIVYE